MNEQVSRCIRAAGLLFQSRTNSQNGCGDLTDTVNASYNFRLYEKGYCPVVIDASGNLTYDLSAKYYTFDHNVLVANACQGP